MNEKHSLFPSAPPGTYPVWSDEAPSDIFIQRICHGGSPEAVCELCGRIHFDSEGRDMEEGELEEMLQKQEENPVKYVGRPGMVHLGDVEGMVAVHDCPCNGLRLYEDFIWKHLGIIVPYVCERAKENLEDAQETMNLTEKLSYAFPED